MVCIKKYTAIIMVACLVSGCLHSPMFSAPNQESLILGLKELSILPNRPTNNIIATTRQSLISIFNDSIGQYCEPKDDYNQTEMLRKTLALAIVQKINAGEQFEEIASSLKILWATFNDKESIRLFIGNSGATVTVQDMILYYYELLALVYLYLGRIEEIKTNEPVTESIYTRIKQLRNHDEPKIIMLTTSNYHIFIDIKKHLSTLELL